MISLKRKQVSASAYNWRPNFRDQESLPDIRRVRTQFFVPALFIFAAVLFASYLGFREHHANTLRGNIAELQAKVDSYRVQHDSAVKANAEFMEIVNDLDEMVAFGSDQIIASDYLLAISSRIPQGLYLTRIDFGPERAVIEGNVEIVSEGASMLVDEYLKSLEQGDVLKGKFTEYKLTSLNREANSNTFKFRIEVTEKAAAGRARK